MFKKIADLLREVFWLKPRPRKRKRAVGRKPAVAGSQGRRLLAKPKAKMARVVKKKAAGPVVDPNLTKVGEITHYFDRIKVAVVKISQGSILVGDKITLAGVKSKFVQKVWSMQIESRDVKVAQKGQVIGLKIDKPVIVGDGVYK